LQILSESHFSTDRAGISFIALSSDLRGVEFIVVPFVKTVKEPILRNLLSLFWEHPVDFDRRCIP
jgi:hypothetical protein